MVMCGHFIPVVVSICDCTNHMLEGGKDNTTYIAEMFQEKINELDPDSKTQMASSSMELPTCKRQEKFCKKPFMGHTAFMTRSMSCHTSLLSIKTEANPGKTILIYFNDATLTKIFSCLF